jgi:uncharacterized membrane protein YhaH (DUF805 family)
MAAIAAILFCVAAVFAKHFHRRGRSGWWIVPLVTLLATGFGWRPRQ